MNQEVSGPARTYENGLSEMAAVLRRDVEFLAVKIAARHVWRYEALVAAAEYIEGELRGVGWTVERQEFDARGRKVWNIEARLDPGPEGLGFRARGDEIVIVGAHYDSFCGQRSGDPGPGMLGTPGADDNGSGVAAVLALARAFAGRREGRGLRLVCFVNEEPPFFQTDAMGSVVYARRCRERGERIIGAITPDTIGYYRAEPGSQRYPLPYRLCGYPRTGDFIAFLSNWGSRRWLRSVAGAFRRQSDFPSLAVAVPAVLRRIGWSDDWTFWRAGYPALTVTDTAFLRTPHYHTPHDLPEHMDFARMARVVRGLEGVVGEVVKK
jgi:hypothetical protein